MTRIIFIIVFVSVANLFASNEWEEVYSLTMRPDKLICPDSNTCYILTDWYPAPLYKTRDKGRNWELVNEIKGETTQDMSSPDSLNVFIIFQDETIHKSSDGGVNFERIKIPSGRIVTTSEIAMYDKDIGIITNVYIEDPYGTYYFITTNGWETYEVFNVNIGNYYYAYRIPIFVNDSILYSIATEYEVLGMDDFGRYISKYIRTTLMKLNIKTRETEFHYLANDIIPLDLFIVNEKIIFACGKSNILSGGTGQDAIYKSTDAGKTWRRVLDLYSTRSKLPGNSAFGLQSIAFKDSLTGIAVGQFGKILYTYDGGESWTYESNLPPLLGGGESNPPTMLVRYAGSEPIIAAFNRSIHTLKKDNLAPKPQDTLTISGRVWEGETGQAGIPVALNTYRITMTDEDGYYKFTNLAEGNYTVKALNKYFDDANPLYYYKPYEYEPEQYQLSLNNDTTGIDFNAVDIRKFYLLSGTARDTNGIGIPDIEIQMNSHIYNVIIHKTTTDAGGNYKFENLEERGRYTITPLTDGYDFAPAYYETPLTSDLHGMDFTVRTETSVKEPTLPIAITHYISGDKLYINSELNTHNLTIKIYDLLGNLALSTEYKQEINISKFPSGIYFLNVFENELIIKQDKFMIIR